MVKLTIIFLIFILFNICWRSMTSMFTIKKNSQHNNEPKPNAKSNIKNLTKCSACNLYLPIEDAIYHNNETFCCTAHAEYKKS